jgi:predicted amidohydrolase
MRIGFIQNHPAYGDREENLRALERALRAAGAPDLWVLPELFAVGYLFGSRAEAARLAEPVPDGPTTQALIRLARGSGSALVAGLAERAPDGRIFNSAVGVDRGGVQAVYRKIHLFDREKEWFDPGDLGFPVVALGGARVGLMICFDWRFPEAARTLALGGAQVIAHPSNLVMPFCQSAMVTRAIENRVFTVTANRIGTERADDGSELTFTGRSRIVAPDGAVLADAPEAVTAVGVVEVNPAQADDKRATARNDVLADRRTEFYRLIAPPDKNH